jgi:hypothetical protein
MDNTPPGDSAAGVALFDIQTDKNKPARGSKTATCTDTTRRHVAAV